MTSTTRTTGNSINIHSAPTAPSNAPIAQKSMGNRQKAINSKNNRNLDDIFSDENDLEAMGALLRKQMGNSQTLTTRDNIKMINALRRDVSALMQGDESSEEAEAVLAILEEMLALIGTYKFNVSATYIG